MSISVMISAEHTSINTLACIVTLVGSYKITVSLNTRAMNFKLSEKTASQNKQNCSKSKGYNLDRIFGTSQLLHNDTLFSRITVTYRTFT